MSNLSSIIDLAFTFRKFGISVRPVQVKDEISELLAILDELKSKTLLKPNVR